MILTYFIQCGRVDGLESKGVKGYQICELLKALEECIRLQNRLGPRLFVSLHFQAYLGSFRYFPILTTYF